MKLDGYVPGDPGSGQSVARPVNSAALLDLRPHDANTDHARSLPATRCVADMVLARCVARWITEDGLRRGDWHSTVLRGVLYMVLLKNVNKHGHAVARAHIIRLKMTLSWPLDDKNLHGGRGKRRLEQRQEPKRKVEPAVSGLRAWCRCRRTTRGCGWEGRIRTANEVALVRLTAGCLTVRHTSQ